MENQEFIDYEIPLRMMKCEVAEYEKQYRSIRAKLKNKKNLKSGEYMYKFRKKDKLVPIVTLILYGGSEKWDGPKSLQEMFDLEKVPEAFHHLLSDYKINVIELREIEDTSVFKTDFKQVVDVIKVSKDREKMKELIESDPIYKGLEPETYDVIAAYVGAKELKRIKKKCTKGGKVDMCQAFREIIEEGRNKIRIEERAIAQAEAREEVRAEGKAEGRAMEIVRLCREFGQTEESILQRLIDELGFKKEEAMLYMA